LRSRVQSAEALLAQKRLYQKHLRSLQQSSLARDILQGRYIYSYCDKPTLLFPRRNIFVYFAACEFIVKREVLT
jgi:hypothetical protein